MASAGRPADTCRPGVRTKPSVACVPGSCVHTPCVSICVRWLSRFCFMLSKPRLGPGGTFGTSICWHLAGRAPLEASRPTLDRAARLRPPCAYFRLVSPLLPMCPPRLRPSQARLSLSHRSPALALAWPRRFKPASGHSNLTGCGHRGSSLYSRHFPARWQRGITLLRLRHLYSIASLVSPSSGRIPQPTSSPFTPP